MSTTAEWVEVSEHINIASYAFFVPILVLWSGLLARTLVQKDREKFYGLIVICILMIVYLVTSIAGWQLNYTYYNRDYKGDMNHRVVLNQSILGLIFILSTTFNLAHWIFAFSYLALSHRLQLVAKDLPEDTHDCRLNIANIIFCLINVALPAISWIYTSKGEYKVANIAYYLT